MRALYARPRCDAETVALGGNDSTSMMGRGFALMSMRSPHGTFEDNMTVDMARKWSPADITLLVGSRCAIPTANFLKLKMPVQAQACLAVCIRTSLKKRTSSAWVASHPVVPVHIWTMGFRAMYRPPFMRYCNSAP